jgi:hypothetical protein
MNWMTLLSGLFKLIPYVVTGVETIHANETTETKTQLAKDALGIATQAATQVLGSDNAAIAQAVSGAVGAGITATQAVVSTLKSTPPQPAA